MQRCEICKIDVRGDKNCCPLCHGPLTGEASESVYPVLGRSKLSRVTISRIVSLIAISFIIVMGTLAYHTNFRHPWFILAIASALVLWIDILLNVYYQHNALKLISVQTYIGIALTLVVDILSGYRGWSVTWVIPFAFLGLAVVTLAIGRGLRMRLTEYLVYLVVDAAFSLVQIVFLCLRMEIFRLPLLLSMGILVAGTLALLAFRQRALRISMEKVFHV